MKKISRSFSSILFLIGALLGLTLTALSVWGDLEAAAYGFQRVGGEQLSALNCPILMTANETSAFSVKLTNSTQGKLYPSIKTVISSYLALPASSLTSVELAPGETKRVEWKVSPENIEFKRFILVYAGVYASYPIPNRENTCGIFIVNLPFLNGAIITWTLVTLSLLGISLGLYGLTQTQGPALSGGDVTRFKLLFYLVIIGLISSFMAWWILGIIVVVVSLLLGVVVTFSFAVKKL